MSRYEGDSGALLYIMQFILVPLFGFSLSLCEQPMGQKRANVMISQGDFWKGNINI